MGIADLRIELADVPGASQMVMRYEQGGDIQVFVLPDLEVRLGSTATSQDIRAAILAERDAKTDEPNHDG